MSDTWHERLEWSEAPQWPSAPCRCRCQGTAPREPDATREMALHCSQWLSVLPVGVAASFRCLQTGSV